MARETEISDENSLSNADQIPEKEFPGLLISIRGLAGIYVVWSFFFFIFGMSINQADRLEGQPATFGFLQVFGETRSVYFYNLLFLVLISTCLVIGLLLILRTVFPEHLGKFLCWKLPAGYELKEKFKSNWPAILTALSGLLASAVLLYALTHFQNDRSHRQPVIFWQGPAEEFIEWLLVTGWTLSYITFWGYIVTQSYFRGRWNAVAFLGLFLGSLNFLASCFIGLVFQAN